MRAIAVDILSNLRQATVSSSLMTMYDIEMHEVSDEFARCWAAAGRHIQARVQGPHSSLKANLNSPALEHLSFRLGNQLFFVRIEDVDDRLDVPGSRAGLFSIAHPSERLCLPDADALLDGSLDVGGGGLGLA